jgi:hypothetical protein
MKTIFPSRPWRSLREEFPPTWFQSNESFVPSAGPSRPVHSSGVLASLRLGVELGEPEKIQNRSTLIGFDRQRSVLIYSPPPTRKVFPNNQFGKSLTGYVWLGLVNFGYGWLSPWRPRRSLSERFLVPLLDNLNNFVPESFCLAAQIIQPHLH